MVVVVGVVGVAVADLSSCWCCCYILLTAKNHRLLLISPV